MKQIKKVRPIDDIIMKVIVACLFIGCSVLLYIYYDWPIVAVLFIWTIANNYEQRQSILEDVQIIFKFLGRLK